MIEQEKLTVILSSLDLREAEVTLCKRALRTSKNIAEACKMLGITRHSLRRRMNKHGIIGCG
jgi:transcriptional regulator with PAS, ATPase and Fis domain